MTEFVMEARNASLEDMAEILKTQRARRLDLVVPAREVKMNDGLLELSGLDMVEKYEDIGDGQKILVEQFDPNGPYRPTRVFDEHVAVRWDIPARYVRRLRDMRPDLYDANVNGWIKGTPSKYVSPSADELAFYGIDNQPTGDEAAPEDWYFDPNLRRWLKTREGVLPDKRNFFLRLFRGEDGGEGVARALMSTRFAPFDNLDGLMALLSGLQQAGIDRDTVEFDRLDLSERGMHVRVAVPEIKALAPNLAGGYRNPFAHGAERAGSAVRGHHIDQWREMAAREGQGYTDEEGGEPVVFAGLGFSNSEVGNGGWAVWPEIIVQVCKNGLQLNAFEVRRRHVGVSLEEGVHWSHSTHETNLALVVSQTRDLVTEFLSEGYLKERVAEVEEKAGVEVGFDKKAMRKVELIGKQVGFTDEHVEGILNFYLRSGQPTAGGVANAITAYSQCLPSPDHAHELDGKAMTALELAAR
jgi:hypothetical protein